MPERDWDNFFVIIRKMLEDEDEIEKVVTPAVEVVTDLFIHKHDMIDQSEIFVSDNIQNINFGKLLENEQYTAYTDFILVTISELFNK